MMSANIGANTSLNPMSSMTSLNRCPPMAMPSAMSRSQELNYVEALKSHQMARLQHIQNEATRLKLYLDTLRKEVKHLEARRRRNPSEDAEWGQKVSKLREENRSLRIECHCLAMQVDLYASGQAPLGVTDENFYRNVPPGPNGSLIRMSAIGQPQPVHPQMSVRAQSPYPVQPMPRPVQPMPPSYEESIYYPPPRFIPSASSSNDILRQVPPPPRPVWLPASPSVQQNVRPMSPLAVHTNLAPPQLPPRPNSASPRTPIAGPSRPPLPQQTVSNQMAEEGQRWTCEKCTVENHPAMAYCEVCEMPRNGYLGICLNQTNNYYANQTQNSEPVVTHVSAADCYCHNCRH